MRLTLRTLLAYLDDTLEPAQAKLIGQKIAESKPAQELMERIKQVTRRRRLTTPGDNGAGGNIDPNTIAEYLDNALTTEQAGEIEQICLLSDVHLAEVAACHQVLTLVLGEPIDVPKSAKQRMLGLPQGEDTTPAAKKPVARLRPDAGNGQETGTLAKLAQQRILWIAGGSALAAGLLVFALSQILKGPGDQQPIDGGPIAQNDKKDKGEPKDPNKEPVKKEEEPKKKEPEPKVEKKEPKKDEPDFPKLDPPKLDFPVLPTVAFAPPENQPLNLGLYRQPKAEQTSVVLVSPADKLDFKRVGGGNLDIQSGRTYVALPGCRGELDLPKKGFQLTLWGNLPEIFALPLWESAVTLHSHHVFDLDMTLLKGRVMLTSTKDNATLRLRFENTTQPSQHEFVDVAFTQKGTELLVDRWGYPPAEPFFKDPKDPKRTGPTSLMFFVVRKGRVEMKLGDVSYSLSQPPGQGLLSWDSMRKAKQAPPWAQLPDMVLDTPPPPPGLDKKLRDDKLKARDDLALFFADKQPDVALAEMHNSPDLFRQELAVFCAGAMGMIPQVVDDLASERRELRRAAIIYLRDWIATRRDNEYVVLKGLQSRFEGRVPERIMDLLHNLGDLHYLVQNLANPVPVIREMAHMNLVMMRPDGRAIPFDPAWDSARLQTTQAAWQALLRKAPPK